MDYHYETLPDELITHKKPAEPQHSRNPGPVGRQLYRACGTQ